MAKTRKLVVLASCLVLLERLFSILTGVIQGGMKGPEKKMCERTLQLLQEQLLQSPEQQLQEQGDMFAGLVVGKRLK